MDNNPVFVRMSSNESLVNLCLSIVVNLSKTGQVDIEQLKELPKNLSHALLNIFSKRGLLTDQNIHVFLGQNTRLLELSECDRLTDLGLEKISFCKYLAKIDLNSHTNPRTLITSAGISNLVNKCVHLQSILLRRCVNVDDTCIETIATCCPKLKNLNVANCPQITDRSLVSLGKNCKNLQSINLSGSKITDEGIYSLFSFNNLPKTLQEVHIANCEKITDATIECILFYCSKIKYLLFHNCPNVTDASRIALEHYMTSNSNQKVKHITWTIY